MKIKTKPMAYRDVMALPRAAHLPPRKPSPLLRGLVRLLAASDLRQTHFSYTTRRMDEAGKGPWLILMNHSSFIDLEMMSRMFAKNPYCIVCTSDGFVGKQGLMRRLGCIPTRKFVSDITLIRDIRYALDTLHTSVLMYPEASYSFDGCATPLPRKLGALLKRLDVPVVGVRTYGAFARDPLYNCLQKRQVDVRAEVSCLLTAMKSGRNPFPSLTPYWMRRSPLIISRGNRKTVWRSPSRSARTDWSVFCIAVRIAAVRDRRSDGESLCVAPPAARRMNSTSTDI